MGDDGESFLVPFLGALQAAVAVLLTICSGVAAAQFGLIEVAASKEISQMSVNMFMPALLITNIGKQLTMETAHRYVPIIVYALAYNLSSMLLGLGLTKFFKMPTWVTPAMAFNNTTSMPLLLVQSLAATGLLNILDSSGTAVDRAKSYFLINSMVSNTLTFAFGPKLITDWEKNSPMKPHYDSEEDDEQLNGNIDQAESEAESNNEETSLLPNPVVRKATRAEYTAFKIEKKVWKRLPWPIQKFLHFLASFLSPPIIGAGIGALIGLVPKLHTLFFEDVNKGGYFSAWLTSALENLGDLFAALQVVVVGVKLSACLLRMKKGEENGRIPVMAVISVTAVRFVLWPLISIAVVYALAAKTGLLSDDPILWFSMMLMPTGPPELMLTALADVSGASDEEKLGIAKFLTIEYAVSPLIFLPVVGSLKASQAVLDK